LGRAVPAYKKGQRGAIKWNWNKFWVKC